MTLVVLTGATRGIGRAAANALAGQGVKPSARAQDDSLARQLWERSAQLVGLSSRAGAP